MTFLLLISSTVISILTGELVFRYVIAIPIPSFQFQLKYPHLFQPYDAHGYRLWPSREMYYRYPPDSPKEIKITSNSYGFRSSREFSGQDERIRILLVGDSFVLGDGVEQDERFSNILEKLEPDWRVENLGMTGFGPGLMLRAFENVGLICNPDVVVWCMYTDDFRRVRPYYKGVGFRIPRYKLESGNLVTRPYPKRMFLDKSAIYHALRHVYWTKTDAIYELNEAILDKFLSFVKPQQFQPVIIFLPGRGDKSWDKERRFWLKRFAEKKGVPFKDFTNVIHSYKRRELFIRKNPHFNPRGHQVTAETLHAFLKQNVITQ